MRAFLLWAIAVSVTFAAEKKELDIKADQLWTDTGIDLKPGDDVTITATGTLQFDGAKTSGPDGMQRGWMDLIMQFPVTNSGRGALIGRFGDNPAARAFLVGAHTERNVPVASRLFLGINEMANMPGTGSFHVTIERKAAPPSKINAAAIPLPKFTQEMLDSIPLRVNDAQGNAGDRVNFVIVGSLEKVQSALSAAGWVVVDKTDKDAVLHGC